uniref:Iron-sulfur cluster assembly 2 homolog, mitochondrial n=1 Tax=Syphacia muris TaxID=451379 RepID=A0A0N5AFZ7_9BILA
MDPADNLVDMRTKQHFALQLELLRLKKEEKALRQFYEKLTVQGAATDLKLTDRCVKRLKEVTAKDEFLRVSVDGGGCAGFEYKMKFDTVLKKDDYVFERDGVRVLVDQLSLEYMKGATLDYIEDLMRAGFRVVNNPVAEKGCSCGSSFAPKLD